jgi:hypothetical protein
MAWSTPTAGRATGYLVTAANWNELASNFIAMATAGQGITAELVLGAGLVTEDGFVNLGANDEKTIASGVITATKSYHSVDTQADAASDDLDTINGGGTGDILVIRAASSARTVVAKDATGNLKLSGDVTLNHNSDTLTLMFYASNWNELSSSNNT